MHRLEVREQLLEFQVACRGRKTALQGRRAAVQMNLRGQRAARHTERQRHQRQHAIRHHHVGVDVGNRQVRVLDDAPAGELDVGVNRLPTVRAELLDRQHLVGRLHRCVAALGLAGIGIGADHRGEIGELQQVRNQFTLQLRPGFACGVGHRAVQVAAAHPACKIFILEDVAALLELAD